MLGDTLVTYYGESGSELDGGHIISSGWRPLQPGQSTTIGPPNCSGIVFISVMASIKTDRQVFWVEYSSRPETLTPVQLQANDFPISINPDWTVTITNNSQGTVYLYEVKLTYNSASASGLGVTYQSPGKLQPGQSASFAPAHSGILSMSVTVTIQTGATGGQGITVTFSSTPETPSVPETPPIHQNDFLITVVPNRQVTITNNAGSTVQILEFSMDYYFYSYIMYNAPGGGIAYGPVVRGVLTSPESAILQPGQSYSKTFNRQDMVSIISCRFSVKDAGTGQTLAVTFP